MSNIKLYRHALSGHAHRCGQVPVLENGEVTIAPGWQPQGLL